MRRYRLNNNQPRLSLESVTLSDDHLNALTAKDIHQTFMSFHRRQMTGDYLRSTLLFFACCPCSTSRAIYDCSKPELRSAKKIIHDHLKEYIAFAKNKELAKEMGESSVKKTHLKYINDYFQLTLSSLSIDEEGSYVRNLCRVDANARIIKSQLTQLARMKVVRSIEPPVYHDPICSMV